MTPMLCNDATAGQLEQLLTDDEWACQQKCDGIRVLAEYNGAVKLYGRGGAPAGLHARVERNVKEKLPKPNFDYAIDGEFVTANGRQIYWLFDMPYGPVSSNSWGKDEAVAEQMQRSFDERNAGLRTLIEVLGDAYLRVVPTAFGIDQKWKLFKWLGETGGEGVIFRRRAAPYTAGRSPSLLRWKFIKSVDCVVFDLAPKGDRECVSVGCFDEKLNLVHVADVSVHGKPPVKLNDVLEVKCSYASETLKLVQPRIARARTDKLAGECSLEQVRLIVGNPAVLPAIPHLPPPSNKLTPPTRTHR